MTLLIKNVYILDGREKISRDIFVSGDRISSIGDFSYKKAKTVLDGKGAYVAPGFIDVYTESDHTLDIFQHNEHKELLSQGITTIIGGQGGISLAPILNGNIDFLNSYADIRKINVDWRNLGELFNIIKKRKIGVNFCTLTGYGTISNNFNSVNAGRIIKNKLAYFKKFIIDSLENGSFGLSFDFYSLLNLKIKPKEMNEIIWIINKYNRVFSIEPQISRKTINYIISLSKTRGLKLLINSFMPVKGFEDDYKNILENIEKLNSGSMRFSVSPHNFKLIPIYRFLPSWAISSNLDEINGNLRNKWIKKRIIEDLPDIKPSDLIIAKSTEDNNLMSGKSLREFMGIYSIKNKKEALLKLMQITKCKALIIYKNINRKLLEKALQHKNSLVFSRESASIFNKVGNEPRQSFKKLLKAAQKKESLASINKTVNKITKEPADFFGLENRGQLKEGYFADIVGFNSNGIKFVVVNGKVAFNEGEFKDTSAGRALKAK